MVIAPGARKLFSDLELHFAVRVKAVNQRRELPLRPCGSHEHVMRNVGPEALSSQIEQQDVGIFDRRDVQVGRSARRNGITGF